MNEPVFHLKTANDSYLDIKLVHNFIATTDIIYLFLNYFCIR